MTCREIQVWTSGEQSETWSVCFQESVCFEIYVFLHMLEPKFTFVSLAWFISGIGFSFAMNEELVSLRIEMKDFNVPNAFESKENCHFQCKIPSQEVFIKYTLNSLPIIIS